MTLQSRDSFGTRALQRSRKADVRACSQVARANRAAEREYAERRRGLELELDKELTIQDLEDAPQDAAAGAAGGQQRPSKRRVMGGAYHQDSPSQAENGAARVAKLGREDAVRSMGDGWGSTSDVPSPRPPQQLIIASKVIDESFMSETGLTYEHVCAFRALSKCMKLSTRSTWRRSTSCRSS